MIGTAFDHWRPSLAWGLLVLLAPAVAWPVSATRADEAVATREEASVRDALKRFLAAFENLDWEVFRASFDDEATVFFPAPAWPERSEGRAAYEGRFRQVFEETRSAAPSGPPFQRLDPEDLRIGMLGPTAAVATFHLRNAERQARRTIVFRKAGAEWLIVHLHASNVPRTVGPK